MPKPVHARASAVRPAPAAITHRTALIEIAVLALLALAAYSPALNGGLLWDDAGHVTKPELRSLHGLWRIWFDLGATQQYYPLLHSAFWIEHRLWGDHVLGYHLINVAWHVTSAALVGRLVRRWRLPGAWLVAAVFAVHPVYVESVAWISEQKNTLSTVFYLLSAMTYLRFDETRRPRTYATALLLFLCALASKTSTSTLPAALLVMLWWQRGRLTWRRDVAPLAPWLALGVGAGLFTAWVEHNVIGAQGSAFDFNVVERTLIAGRVIWFYVATLVWPVGLTFSYPRWSIDASAAWQYLFPATAIAVVVWLWTRPARNRAPLAGALFFIGTLVPALGFVNVYPFLYSFVADHFQYIASLGVIVPLACGATLAMRARWTPRTGFIAGSLLVGVLAVLTWRQSQSYRDVETLYRDTIARNPTSWMARGNLGIELATRDGGLPEAIEQFQAALRLRPAYVEGHRNLALAYWNAGRTDDAIREYQAALALEPAFARDHLALGQLLAQRADRLGDAIMHLQTAVRLDPSLEDAHYALGGLLAATQPAEAIAHYQTVLRLNPARAEAHLNLANLLATRPGNIDAAISEYGAALRARPVYPEAHFNLGNVLMDVPGHANDAIAEFEAAIAQRPDYAEAHSNLALVLSDIPGRRDDAIAHLESALRINPALAQPRALLNELVRPRR